MAANNGFHYGRTTSDSSGSPVGHPKDAEISKFDAATGAIVTTFNVAGMGGISGNDSFNWGEFSAPAVMNDRSNIFVVGGSSSSSNFRVSSFDYDLNLVNNYSVDVTLLGSARPGYGFSIGGFIYFGDTFNSGQISARLNTSTGGIETVDFLLTGLGSSMYLSGMSYDTLNDTLYVHNATGTDRYYKVENAAAAFGVTVVPEPSVIALFSAALGALVCTRRRRTVASLNGNPALTAAPLILPRLRCGCSDQAPLNVMLCDAAGNSSRP